MGLKYGFIGCGNMARAMISGMIDARFVRPEDIYVSNRTQASLDTIQAMYPGVSTTRSNRDVAGASDILILSIKPQVYPEVIEEIRSCVSGPTVVVTIAPGFTLTQAQTLFDKDVKIIRCMPNTPAMVASGMTAFVPNDGCKDVDIQNVKNMLLSFGRCVQVRESQMDIVTALSGSSPAYVFLFIEAMADAAVHEGMSRPMAYELASQAVLGSAKMVLDTQKHPGELKDMVCSPSGTTIEAVRILEQKGFRSALIEAVIACTQKARGE